MTWTKIPPPNVAACFFKDHEGAFLAGIVAGLATDANKVSFIGGIRSAVISRFEVGFKAGVRAASQIRGIPIGVQVVYANSFNDESQGYSLARMLFAQGNDVIYHAAAKVSKGICRAAKEAGGKHWVIGTDKDQLKEAPDHILGSVLKRTDAVMEDMVNKVRNNDVSSFGKVSYYGVGMAIDFKGDYASKLGAGKAKKLDLILEVARKYVQGVPDTPEKERTWSVPTDFMEAAQKIWGPSGR